jgi:hypothetical protein
LAPSITAGRDPAVVDTSRDPRPAPGKTCDRPWGHLVAIRGERQGPPTGSMTCPPSPITDTIRTALCTAGYQPQTTIPTASSTSAPRRANRGVTPRSQPGQQPGHPTARQTGSRARGHRKAAAEAPLNTGRSRRGAFVRQDQSPPAHERPGRGQRPDRWQQADPHRCPRPSRRRTRPGGLNHRQAVRPRLHRSGLLDREHRIAVAGRE